MKGRMGFASLLAGALTFVAAPNGAWAEKGSGRQSSAARGGGHQQFRGNNGGGARAGFPHHHHPRFYGAFYFGSPFGYPYYSDPFFYGMNPYYRGWPPYYGWPPYGYGWPPYYYGLEYDQPQYDPAAVYIEKFAEIPSPETKGEIYCPDRSAHYPDVQDCPGGWQRVFRPPQASAPPILD